MSTRQTGQINALGTRRHQGRDAVPSGRRHARRHHRRARAASRSSTAATACRAADRRSPRRSRRSTARASSSMSTTSSRRAARAIRPMPVTARATATCVRDERGHRPAPTGWPATRPASATHDVFIVGDLNSYAKEDPITVLERRRLHEPGRRVRQRRPTRTSSTGSGATSTTPSASPRPPRRWRRGRGWHINADEPAVLDYNTELQEPRARSAVAVRRRPVPRLRPRPDRRRPRRHVRPPDVDAGRTVPRRRSSAASSLARRAATHRRCPDLRLGSRRRLGLRDAGQASSFAPARSRRRRPSP